MGQDAGDRILEQVEAAACPLRGNEAAHDDAPELRRVSHGAGLRVSVLLDRVVHGPVVQHRVRLAPVILEQAHADVDEVVRALGCELVLHLIVCFGWQALPGQQCL
jgi:hypothetical protein